MNKELKELSNKYRFIELIITNKLIVNRKKKVELESELEELGFDKIEDSYNYLTNMSIFQLTEEKFIKLKEEFEDMNKKIKKLQTMTVDTLWTEDIKSINCK
jgi:hypothetical protein